MIELGIVGIIVLVQFFVFFRNLSSINELGSIYPDSRSLKSISVAQSTANGGSTNTSSIDVIEDSSRFSATFREIVDLTNSYLKKNEGEADFEVLKEMAHHQDDSKEKAIESNITLPLYIGLLCTFLGVIIGLVKISIVGVSDGAIQSFIGGVLIGMVGSANGLALTVRSNFSFKERKQERDRGKYDYFTFLRTYILPALRKEIETPVSTLKENLKAFNESFVVYQQNVNESLQGTLKLFGELKQVFSEIRKIEQGVNGVGHFIQANGGLLEKQVAYIDNYVEKADAFSKKLGVHFQHVDKKMGELVKANVASLESSTKAAYMKMDQYLSGLNKDESKQFVDTLKQDIGNIQQNVNGVQRKNAEINAKLIEQLTKDTQSNEELAKKMEMMSMSLEKVATQQKSNFMESFGFKFFVVAGSAAFVLGIMSGVVFLLNTFTG